MKITSPNWNENLGVCEKHLLPSVPCPACLADGGDEDVEYVVTDTDLLALEAAHMLGEDLALGDLVPANITDPQLH